MRKFSKTICLIVLCFFAWTVTAGAVCCCEIFDQPDSQQETMSESCHSDQNKSDHEPEDKSVSDSVCQEMSSCGGSNLFTSNVELASIKIIHESNKIAFVDQFISNSAIPPTPPPKI